MDLMNVSVNSMLKNRRGNEEFVSLVGSMTFGVVKSAHVPLANTRKVLVRQGGGFKRSLLTEENHGG